MRRSSVQQYNSFFNYANFGETTLEDVALSGGQFRQACFSKVKLKRFRAEKSVFSQAEFYKTPLAGVDLSTCDISGIVLSESLSELKGAKVAPFQAVELAELLGLKIV